MNTLWTVLFLVYLVCAVALIARSFRNQPHDSGSCPVCQNAEAMSGRDIERLLIERERSTGRPLGFRARTDERGDRFLLGDERVQGQGLRVGKKKSP